jgi:hypothetical protein
MKGGRMFCKHKWIVLEKIVLDSAYEQMAKDSQITKVKHLYPNHFVKKAMVIVTCEKCSKIKKFEIVN